MTRSLQVKFNRVVGPPSGQPHQAETGWCTVNAENVAPTSGLGLIVRLYWLMLGNAALFFLAVLIAEKNPPFPFMFDIIYFATVASMILARYLDVRVLGGTNGEGKLATIQDFRGYAAMLLGVSLLGWIAANAVKRFF